MDDATEHNEKLITAHTRRLEELELRRATLGVNTPPEVITEIEDILKEIQRLKSESKDFSLQNVVNCLPPRPPLFVRRDAEIAEIMWRIKSPDRRSPIVVEGTFGIGKSALVNTVAHMCFEQHLFDAYIWWSAQYDPYRSVGDLIDLVSSKLGRPTENGQPIGTKEALYDLLRQRSCLLIITKVTQIDHKEIIDFVKCIPQPTCVLLTTTSPLPIGDHLPSLTLLSRTDSMTLLLEKATQLDCKSILRSSEEILSYLCESCDGLPAALNLAVTLAKKGEPVSDITEALIKSEGEEDVKTLCAKIYKRLEKPARDVLNLICCSQDLIAGSAIMEILQFERSILKQKSLEPLRDMGLLLERLSESDTLEERRFAPVNHLVRKTYVDMLKKQPNRYQQLRRKVADYYTSKCLEYGNENWFGYNWIEQNLTEIVSAMNWYDDNGLKSELIKLFKTTYYFLGVRGHWRQRLEYGSRAAQAAEYIGDKQSKAEILVRVLGWTKIQFEEYDQAKKCILEGSQLFRDLNDNAGLATAYRYLGTIERRQNNYKQALDFYEKGLACVNSVDNNDQLKAGIEISIGTLYMKMHEFETSQYYLAQARETFEKLRHISKVAEIISRIADVSLLQKRFDEAEQLYQQSQQFALQVGRQKTSAYNFLGLALVAYSRGNNDEAHAKASEAHRLFSNLGIANESAELTRLQMLLTAGSSE